MRKIIYASRFIMLASFVFFYSCKKNDQVAQENANSLMASKVTEWLEKQKSATNQERNKRIQAIADNLDFSKLRLEELGEGENFIVVPIKKTLTLINNKGKNPINTLLLIIDKTGNIRKGNIVQFLPKNKAIKACPTNTFHDIYNFRKLKEDGTFVFLSITDLYQYEWIYEGGQLAATKGWKKLNASSSSERSTQNCIEWYLVTTWYFSDGHTETESVFVGRTCSCGNGDPTQVQNFCDDEPPGGGGDVEEPMAFTTKNWAYAINQAYNWAVVPAEGFNGVKKSSLPNGGYFTEFSHADDGFTSISSDFSWERTFMRHDKLQGSATVHFAGKIVDQVTGTNSIGVKQQTFLFNQVYP